MKYERPSFIVVTASKEFREGWDKIEWNKTTDSPSSISSERIITHSSQS